ncbi:MAG TPA: BREX system ATP-binding domain-containing protein, partial [Rhodopila sp.]
RLERVVIDSGYRWPDPGRRTTLVVLAEANEVAPALMRMQINQEITRTVWQDASLAQDFRNAMIALLATRLADDGDALHDAVLDWLQGAPGRLGAARNAQIGAKIGRNNARAMLKSLCHWLRLCGGTGILLAIDVRRLLRDRRDVQDGHTYSPAAVMDCYEVLRQMIDDAGHLEGFFLAVLADPLLLADDLRRSLNQYTALKMRVWDDVRPEQGDNPLAPLVHVL